MSMQMSYIRCKVLTPSCREIKNTNDPIVDWKLIAKSIAFYLKRENQFHNNSPSIAAIIQ